jgi:ABC-2 type transport system ATP-binding protein
MEATSPLIEAAGLVRTFTSSRKAAGLRAALRSLVHPEKVRVEALKNVSFTIQAGEFVGLVGANGAGKTTLLKILAGLIPPTRGTAHVLGHEPFRRPIDFRRRIALVMGQKAQLWWDLPAIDAFELLKAIYDIPEDSYRERIALLTSLLDVGDLMRTQIRRLSLGERMKMELIGALLHWPEVVFLDEPTLGLDVLAAHRLREFLREFNRMEKATIILTSHNMEDIERLCPRILILRSGELIYDGAPSRLTRQGERRLRVRLLETPDVAELARVTGVDPTCIAVHAAASSAADLAEVSPGDAGDIDSEDDLGADLGDDGPGIHFAIQQEQIAPTLQALLSHYVVLDMGIQEQSLERVIQGLYEGGA